MPTHTPGHIEIIAAAITRGKALGLRYDYDLAVTVAVALKDAGLRIVRVPRKATSCAVEA